MNNYQTNNQQVHTHTPQNQPLLNKRNPFQLALILLITGIALFSIGSVANAIHRHIYLGETSSEYSKKLENEKKDLEEYEKYKSSSYSDPERVDRLVKQQKAELEYVNTIKNSVGSAQMYNIIGIIISVIASIIPLVLLFAYRKKTLQASLALLGVFTIATVWQFLTVFNRSFFHIYESTIVDTLSVTEKVVYQTNPFLATLYATLMLAGCLLALYAMYFAYKNADEIIAEKHQLNMLRQQQHQFQQQMQQQMQQQGFNSMGQNVQPPVQSAPQPLPQQAPQHPQTFAQHQGIQPDNK